MRVLSSAMAAKPDIKKYPTAMSVRRAADHFFRPSQQVWVGVDLENIHVSRFGVVSSFGLLGNY